jgi:hypothetical protein
MNCHHTFVWPIYANREDFHSCILSFYLDVEAFDKEIMSCHGVKRKPHKSGMNYVLPMDLLKKRGQEEGVGSSSSMKVQKKESPTQMDSDEEEETQPQERKKRTLPMFSQLSKQAMLTGKDFNGILSTAFITDPMAKKTRMGISPSKVLNPQPFSSTIPRTRSMARATHIIDIQDDPEPDITPYTTIITEKPPSPPQPHFPPPETTIISQTIDLEPM